MIDVNIINKILADADVEGYIEFGAPADEYSSEALYIKEGLKNIKKEEFTLLFLFKLIEGIWSESFGLEGEELELRKENLISASNKIYTAISKAA